MTSASTFTYVQFLVEEHLATRSGIPADSARDSGRDRPDVGDPD